MADCLRLFLLGAFLLAAHTAHGLQAGDPLPPLEVAKLGEVLVEGEESSFRPWQSGALSDRLHIVQYMAARMSARTTQAAICQPP
jgi:predicted transcriptional regulator